MSEYRLDDLATHSGVSVRNIRAYRERGLLDAPRRVGRSVFYGEHHLAQLQAVNELLRKGYTSAHIAEFLDGTRQGLDLAEILGLQQAVFGPPGRAVAAVDLDPGGDEAQRLVQHGLAVVVDGEVTLVNPDIADIVGRGTEQFAYVQTILRVSDGIADQLEELATAVVEALGRGSPPSGDAVESHRAVADHRALGRRVVAAQLEGALQRHLGDG